MYADNTFDFNYALFINSHLQLCACCEVSVYVIVVAEVFCHLNSSYSDARSVFQEQLLRNDQQLGSEFPINPSSYLQQLLVSLLHCIWDVFCVENIQ